MNELLFYSLLAALGYYFLVYAKPTRPDPQSTHSQSTQTEPLISEPEAIPNAEQTIKELEREKETLLKDQAQKQRTIQSLNQSKNAQLQTLEQQISTLQTQITQLSQAQKTSETATQKEQKDLEKTLDQLIKGMNDLNKEL